VETFFWTFCDDYLELVKERAYGAGETEDNGQASAIAALREALETLLRLFAPFVPFATEEAWSWFREGSLHVAAWPAPGQLDEAATTELLTLTGEALTGIRGAKTDAKASQKTQVASAVIAGPDGKVELLQLAEGDLRAVGRIDDLSFEHGPEVRVTSIVLAPNDEL
jgi:valyl-tRNA synthetase